MGALMQGVGSIAGAAKGSLLTGAVGTGLDAASQLAGGVGQSQQYAYQAQVAVNNAAITRSNEAAALTAGQAEESNSKLRAGALIGEQLAAQGANGLDVNVGSPSNVRQATATVGAMDAAMIHYNAARQAFGLESEAGNFETQAALDRSAASNATKVGATKAFSTILSGATALSSKWAGYKSTGALASGGAKGAYTVDAN